MTGSIEITGDVELRTDLPMYVLRGDVCLIEASMADRGSRRIACASLSPGLAPRPFRLHIDGDRISSEEDYLLTAHAHARSVSAPTATEQRFETVAAHPWAPSQGGAQRIVIAATSYGRTA